ncbi:hypothetical protein NDU88_005034 [Pleurodeles waltl]|uniref:Uncharacterized protein n=1 Tax=Pleurodeles waltl TaxID=8319 RepID=A0AAV7UGV7_PLEWA|nr:hypothetical protein NDU88_005034 [Pleurodeles waltl]
MTLLSRDKSVALAITHAQFPSRRSTNGMNRDCESFKAITGLLLYLGGRRRNFPDSGGCLREEKGISSNSLLLQL